MREIKEYTDEIKEEFEGAKKYAKKAVKCKELGDKETGKMYYDMANDEMRHAMNIHNLAVKAVEKARETVTPPQYMLDMWNEKHDYYMEEVAKIKYMLSEFAK